MKQLTRFAFVSILAVAFVSAGCKKGSSDMLVKGGAAPTLQPGWTTYDLGSFSFAAPPELKRTKPNPMGDMGSISIGEDGQVQQQQPPPALTNETVTITPPDNQDGPWLVLYDHEQKPNAGEIYTTLKVKKEEGFTKLEEALERVKKGESAKDAQIINVPAGRVGVVKVTQQNIGGDEESRIVYVFVHDGSLYRLGFESLSMVRLEQYADAVIQSLRGK
jgi:hypothetical protein